MWNLHALLRRLGIEDNFSDVERLSSGRQSFDTEFSATVFSGDPQHWTRYLGMSRGERYTEDVARIVWSQADRTLIFRPEGPGAQELASCLNSALPLLRQQLRCAPHASQALDPMIFTNASNAVPGLKLRVSATLPSDATREADLDDDLTATDTCVVLRNTVVKE